ncbi:MAG: hypothetical protein H9535_00550 [Ignavibacteria bacterium]|nr:hypothetical protein [Ignavibacteria bacterium]
MSASKRLEKLQSINIANQFQEEACNLLNSAWEDIASGRNLPVKNLSEFTSNKPSEVSIVTYLDDPISDELTPTFVIQVIEVILSAAQKEFANQTLSKAIDLEVTYDAGKDKWRVATEFYVDIESDE